MLIPFSQPSLKPSWDVFPASRPHCRTWSWRIFRPWCGTARGASSGWWRSWSFWCTACTGTRSHFWKWGNFGLDFLEKIDINWEGRLHEEEEKHLDKQQTDSGWMTRMPQSTEVVGSTTFHISKIAPLWRTQQRKRKMGMMRLQLKIDKDLQTTGRSDCR